MAEFLEQRFPLAIRLGSSYSDDYNVEITRTAGGKEYRRLVHPIPLRRFKVSFVRSKTDLFDEVVSLYHRVYGRYAGFRVRAIDDYSTNANTLAPTTLDQPLIRISAGVYQLVKLYGTNGAALPTIGHPHRTLFKPVAGTVRIAINGVETTTGVSVNTTTGRVTISPAPAEGASVTGGCEFDIPCRFDSVIDVTPISPNFAETEEIELVELIDL